MTLSRHLRQLLDVIYPPRCAVCSTFLKSSPFIDAGIPLPFCHTCTADFRPLTPPLCPICGTPFPSKDQESHPCGECLARRPHYDRAGALYTYEGTLLQAIYGLKYGGKTFLADALGSLLSDFAQKWIPEPVPQYIMPVPLHKKRLRERGFNQSLLLSRHVANALTVELDFLSLRRVKYTLPQTGLAKKERHKNIRGAFEIKNPSIVKNKTILLVDDVATTGNTLNECARVLKRAKARNVYCVTLARATNI